MSKVKTAFFCSNCGYESAKWIGKCPSCGNWNTFVEEIIHKDTSQKNNGWKDYHDDKKTVKAVALNEITSSELK
jgi:DNA repair protein RadA/Sms